MVRCGQLTAFAGTVLLFLPAGDGAVLAGLIMVDVYKRQGLYNDLSYLDKVNAELKSHYAYLIVRKGDTILYCGDSNKAAGEAICAQLPRFDMMKGDLQLSLIHI